MNEGEGEGEGRKETHPLPALLLPPFFARSLTLVPRSLLIDRTETLATQAKPRLVLSLLCDKFDRAHFARSLVSIEYVRTNL